MDKEFNLGVDSDNSTFNNSIIAGLININHYLNEKPGEDRNEKKLMCYYCDNIQEIENIQENGNVTCNKCKQELYTFRNFIKVGKHKKVPSDKHDEYDNLIFQISLKIQQGLYEDANNICDKAIKLYSQSPQGLEYKALCLYYTTKRTQTIDTSARQILVHLKSAYEIEEGSINYQKIASGIAFKYFQMLKYRIKDIKNKQLTSDLVCKFIAEFSTCYEIFPSIKFLKYQASCISGCEGYSFVSPFKYGEINVDSQKDREITGLNGEKYLLKDYSIYQNGVFPILTNLEREIRRMEHNYNLPKFKITYKNKILDFDEFKNLRSNEIKEEEENEILIQQQLRLKEEEEEREENRRITEEENRQEEYRKRKVEEERERQNYLERERQKRQEEEERRQEAYRKEKKKKDLKLYAIIAGIVIVLTIIYINWAAIVAFFIGLFKLVLGIVIIGGIISMFVNKS